MNNITETSEHNRNRALAIIHDLKITETWKSFGATAHMVGSVRMGLLMKHLDIDFHIYSENFSITDSFAAIATFATNPRIKKVTYANLIDTEERCIEWHLWYEDGDHRVWQIDMIHILNDSPYAGKFERVADRITAVLTERSRYAILSIKNSIPADEKVMGVEIYQAVIRDGVMNYPEFREWREKNQPAGIIDWMP